MLIMRESTDELKLLAVVAMIAIIQISCEPLPMHQRPSRILRQCASNVMKIAIEIGLTVCMASERVAGILKKNNYIASIVTLRTPFVSSR